MCQRDVCREEPDFVLLAVRARGVFRRDRGVWMPGMPGWDVFCRGRGQRLPELPGRDLFGVGRQDVRGVSGRLFLLDGRDGSLRRLRAWHVFGWKRELGVPALPERDLHQPDQPERL